MHAIEAIYDGFNFIPTQPVQVNENYKVIITFVEPVKNNKAYTGGEKKLPRSTAFGIWKDKVWMSDDFNEPLEEMKEYME